MSRTIDHDPLAARSQMPVAVQILSTILFAAFAISVSIVALVFFLPAGIALAIFLGWRGGFAPTLSRHHPVQDIARDIAPRSDRPSTGNNSFDAYRQATLDRLEQEQDKFDAFLTRLREARDKTEFDQFMDDRAGRSEAIASH